MKSKNVPLLIFALAGVFASSCQRPPATAENVGPISNPVWDWATTGAYGTADPEFDGAAFRVDTERMATHSWWNQPSMVEALDLQSEQRSDMDEVMAAYLSRWAPMGAKRTKGRERITEAIKARDFDSARRIADEFLVLQAERIAVSGKGHLDLVRLEMELLDKLRSIYTLAKRIAKDFVPDEVASKV